VIKGSECTPLSVIADFEAGKILILCSIGKDVLFSYYEASRKKSVIKIAEEVFQDLSDYSNLELSSEKTVGFIAGSK
jgi:hypothetical protein